MNRIAGIINMHFKGKFILFYIPWLILLSSFMINLLISFIIGNAAPYYTGGIASIYIYTLIMGSLIVNDTYPFALGFSMRRIDYFLGTATMIVLVSVVTALLLLLCAIIESELTRGWGTGMHFFHLPYINDGPLVAQFWIYFAVMVHMYLLGFGIACLYQRFGRYGMWFFFIIAFLLVSIFTFLSTSLNWWSTIYSWFSHHSASDVASWMALIAVGYVLGSYGLLRKAIA